MSKKRKNLIAILGVLSIALITIGTTYAFFSYSRSGSTENTIKSGSITFLYDEINRSGNSIGIVDALPTSDTDGKAQTNAFNFKIVSQTATDMAIPYEITLRQKQGTDNIGDKIKVYLSKTIGYEAPVNTETEVKTSLFSALPDTTHNNYSEKTLHTDEVPQSSTNYTQFYRLKMWLDESVDLSNEAYNGKTFTVMVNVYANGRIASSNANVESISVNNTLLTAVNANEYVAELEPETTQATVAIETEDTNSTVDIIKTQSDYTTPIAIDNNIQRLSNTVNRTVDLTTGDNYFKITVTSENNQTTKEQHLKITVPEATFVLKDRILANNTLITASPTLNNSINNTSDASGLYKLSVTNGFGGANGDTYYFRGNVANNKIKFAGKDWLIIRINEDGTVRLILDGDTDGQGHIFNTNYDNHSYMYYSNSSIKTDVENWYNANIIGTNASKVATGNYFCEAARVKYRSDSTGNAATITQYSLYTPDLKCETDGNGYGIVANNPSVGLINYDEVVFAGGYANNSTNNRYYLYSNTEYWIMSPGGLHYGSYASAWRINVSGYLNQNVVTGTYRIRPVINLKADVRVQGSGTSSDPYVVQ